MSVIRVGYLNYLFVFFLIIQYYLCTIFVITYCIVKLFCSVYRIYLFLYVYIDNVLLSMYVYRYCILTVLNISITIV